MRENRCTEDLELHEFEYITILSFVFVIPFVFISWLFLIGKHFGSGNLIKRVFENRLQVRREKKQRTFITS
jgi:hypothetical protein